MLKSLPKILIIFFLVIFIFQLACLLFLALRPGISQAADIQFTPQVQIPDYTFNSSDKTTGNIANYVRAIYKYAIGIVGILAAVVLMIGGVLWIVAGGSATAIGEAKAWIGASLTGLVIALASYLILATINPALVDFKTTGIKTVEEIKIDGIIKQMDEEESLCFGSYEGSNFSGTIIRGKEEATARTDCNIACAGQTNIAVFKTLNTSKGYCCICKPGITAQVGSNCNGIANGTPCDNGFCYDNNCTSEKGQENDYCGPKGSGGICFKIDLMSLSLGAISSNINMSACSYGFHQVLGGRNCDGLLLACCARD